MTAQDAAGVADYNVDLEFDFGNLDETGYLWAWLHNARDPDEVRPGTVLTVRDGDDLAMGRVIDLVAEANGIVVHLELIPGAVADFHAAIERATFPLRSKML